jgi:hypothetical protein
MLCIQCHQKRNYKELGVDARKPELNAGRYQATLFILLYSWGCVGGTNKYEVHLKISKETHTCASAKLYQ